VSEPEKLQRSGACLLGLRLDQRRVSLRGLRSSMPRNVSQVKPSKMKPTMLTKPSTAVPSAEGGALHLSGVWPSAFVILVTKRGARTGILGSAWESWSDVKVERLMDHANPTTVAGYDYRRTGATHPSQLSGSANALPSACRCCLEFTSCAATIVHRLISPAT
jgi:hypothetical protein